MNHRKKYLESCTKHSKSQPTTKPAPAKPAFCAGGSGNEHSTETINDIEDRSRLADSYNIVIENMFYSVGSEAGTKDVAMPPN